MYDGEIAWGEAWEQFIYAPHVKREEALLFGCGLDYEALGHFCALHVWSVWARLFAFKVLSKRLRGGWGRGRLK